MQCLGSVTRPAAQLVHQTLGFSRALQCQQIVLRPSQTLLPRFSACVASTAQVRASGSNCCGSRAASSISGFSFRPSFARVPATGSFSTGVSRRRRRARRCGVYRCLRRKLAKSIVEAKLAACVNMVPGAESTYWWEGKVTTDSEVLLIAKTRQSLLGELTAFVKANHPYDLPEVISLPITGGHDKYLDWLGKSTERKG